MQTLKQSILQTILSAMAALCIISGGTVLFSSPAQAAINCAVLPQSLCNSVDPGNKTTKAEQSPILSLLKVVLQILTALVGIAAVAGIIYAAVLYTSAGDQQDKVQKAKTIITDVVIGLVAYAMMFLLLNWLVPGGVLGS